MSFFLLYRKLLSCKVKNASASWRSPLNQKSRLILTQDPGAFIIYYSKYRKLYVIINNDYISSNVNEGKKTGGVSNENDT